MPQRGGIASMAVIAPSSWFRYRHQRGQFRRVRVTLIQRPDGGQGAHQIAHMRPRGRTTGRYRDGVGVREQPGPRALIGAGLDLGRRHTQQRNGERRDAGRVGTGGRALSSPANTWTPPASLFSN